MSGARAPMPPPELAGFTFQRLLGSGGYSDVFLYEQEMPRRPVAIKVLLAAALDDVGRRQFTDEANTMAALSTHPFIVTIFHAEVGQGGRPFLVMEFYPRPNFSVRARTEQMSLANVLRTGIQVASAVETAHRAGILHRDIKPANILTSEYGRPGLTDFGIASTTIDGAVREAEGMSIPWSPPEVISGSATADATADVYSLAATLYTLLAGRSPFEVPGGSNRSLDLIDRIARSDVPPTGRGDVPESLERLLRQAMGKAPADRPASAAALARGLQAIEVEQQFGMTPLEVRDEGTDARARTVDPEDGTRLKAPVIIRSQSTTGSVTASPIPGAPPVTPTDLGDGTVHRSAWSSDGLIAGVGSVPPQGLPSSLPFERFEPAPAPSDAQSVSARTDAPSAEKERSAPGRNPLVTAAFVLLATVVALVLVRLVMGASDDDGGGGEPDPPTVTTPVTPKRGPAPPSDVTISRDASGAATVSWTVPSGQDPQVKYLVTSPSGSLLATSEPGATSVVIPAAMQPPPCVEVHGTLDGGVPGESTSGC